MHESLSWHNDDKWSLYLKLFSSTSTKYWFKSHTKQSIIPEYSLSLSLLLPSPHQPTFCTHVKCIEIYMIYLDDVKKCLAALNIKSNLHYGHIGNWESWLMILHFKKIKSELKKIPVSKSQELHEGHKIILNAKKFKLIITNVPKLKKVSGQM